MAVNPKSTSRKSSSEKQRKFAEEMLRTGNQTEAARRVGYTGPSARASGNKMAHTPIVKALVAEAQKAVQAKINYGLEQAMQEAQDAIEFAKKTENANAYVKAVELRTKLNGLLVEKLDVRQSGFTLNVHGFTPIPIPKPEDDGSDIFG